jgi:hypothetical protein
VQTAPGKGTRIEVRVPVEEPSTEPVPGSHLQVVE